MFCLWLFFMLFQSVSPCWFPGQYTFNLTCFLLALTNNKRWVVFMCSSLICSISDNSSRFYNSVQRTDQGTRARQKCRANCRTTSMSTSTTTTTITITPTKVSWVHSAKLRGKRNLELVQLGVEFQQYQILTDGNVCHFRLCWLLSLYDQSKHTLLN